ncbi:heterokaryon incompatibility protein domain-containing protein [Trichoderma chlorosporum]
MSTAPNSAIAPLLYRPLKTSADNRDEQEIRFLSITSPINQDDISCELHTISLSKAEDNFYALSYVWGNAFDTIPIKVNGHIFQATRNLVEALRYVQVVEPRCRQALWVDAICINQHDVPERNSQVSLMGLIYRYAHEVLCWLGPRDDTSDYVIQFINQMSYDIKTCRDETLNFAPLHSPTYSKIIAKIHRTGLFGSPVLLERQYWKRAWTFQEVVLAKECRIIAGSCSFEISMLDHVVIWIHDFVISMANFDEPLFMYEFLRGDSVQNVPTLVWEFLQLVYEDTLIAYPASAICTERRVRRRKNFISDYENGMNTMNTVRPRNATDARDKVYAVAGLIPIGISVDYAASIQDVYLNYAKHVITRISNVEQFLSFAGVSNPVAHAGPSWVPDWSSMGPVGRIMRPMRFDMQKGAPVASHRISVAGNNLHLNGVVIGLIQDTMPNISPGEKWTKTSFEAQVIYVRKVIEFYLRREPHAILEDIIAQATPKQLYPTGISVIKAVLQIVWTGRPEHWKDGGWVWAALAPFVKLLTEKEGELTETTYPGPSSEDAKRDSRDEAILSSICSDGRTDPISMAELVRIVKGSYYGELMRVSPLTFSSGVTPFITTNGFMGYGMGSLQPGDVIFASGSAKASLVLRKSSSGIGYTLLTFCYVAGIVEEKFWADVEDGVNNWKIEEVVIT